MHNRYIQYTHIIMYKYLYTQFIFKHVLNKNLSVYYFIDKFYNLIKYTNYVLCNVYKNSN